MDTLANFMTSDYDSNEGNDWIKNSYIDGGCANITCIENDESGNVYIEDLFKERRRRS